MIQGEDCRRHLQGTRWLSMKDTVPSQRFSSESASTLPLQSGSYVPPMTSSHVDGKKRGVFEPLNSAVAALLPDKLHYYSSAGVNLGASKEIHEQNDLKLTDLQHPNAKVNPSLFSNCDFFQPHNFLNPKNVSAKKLEDHDTISVPTLSQSEMIQNSIQLVATSKSHVKGISAEDVKTGLPQKNQTQAKSIISLSGDYNIEWPSLISLTRENAEEYAISNRSIKEDTIESLKWPYPSSDEAFCRDCNLLEQEKCIEVDEASMAKPESYSGPSSRKDRQFNSFVVGHACKNDDIPDASLSISGWDITPDEVVGVLGEKEFWKIRRVIISQQRVFAVQVFELHRLIKVQRTIARSPHIFLQSSLFLSNLSSKSSPVKPSHEYDSELPWPSARPKVASRKRTSCLDSLVEDYTATKFSLPVTVTTEINKRPVTLTPGDEPFSESTPLEPICTNTPPAPWGYPYPWPGNQWLVPVISPSEGLVYKPYGGPCLPPAAFMGPSYDSCVPLNFPPESRYFFDTVFGVPSSGMAILNANSSPAAEQMNPFSGAQFTVGSNLLLEDINLTMHHQSFCGMSIQKSGNYPYGPGKSQPSNDGALQCSRCSSGSGRAEADTLPLFPVEPTVQVIDKPAENSCSKLQAQAIKVVPHNSRSAMESAARIFQSVQEERKNMVRL